MRKIFLASVFGFFMGNTGFAKELPDDYQTWSAEKKQTFLWEKKIVPSTHTTLPPLTGGGWSSIFTNVKSLATPKRSFTVVSDEMLAGRPKVLHPFGTVVQVVYETNGMHGYTGIYAEKAALGLARLSLAGNPKRVGFTPGMALKFFVNGKPSLNLHVMNSLNGQSDDPDFFRHPFSNIVPKPNGKILNLMVKWFSLFVKNPLHLKVNHLAERSANGAQVKAAVSPYQILFVPPKETKVTFDKEDDFRDSLKVIPKGTVLYTVLGRDKDKNYVELGKIKTTSSFIASRFGDKHLYFQHHE